MLILFLLCCLLGLSCYSYVQYDHTEKHDNNVCEVEHKERNNYAYVDEYGIQLTMTFADFMSNTFITTFVKGLYSNYNTQIGILVENGYDITWSENINDTIYSLDLSTNVYTPVWDVDYIVFSKTYLGYSSYQDTDIILADYYLTFYSDNGSIQVLRYIYHCFAPFYDPSEHEGAGLSCLSVEYFIRGNGNIRNIVLFENDNDGYSPLIVYFHQFMLDDRVAAYNNGYQVGYNNGYQIGYNRGSNDVNQPIYDEGYASGYQYGYSDGYSLAIEQGTTAATIFSGIVNVGLLPVNVFLKIFEFEVFGINIAGLISALLTVSVTIILIRFLTGQKNDK